MACAVDGTKHVRNRRVFIRSTVRVRSDRTCTGLASVWHRGCVLFTNVPRAPTTPTRYMREARQALEHDHGIVLDARSGIIQNAKL